MAVGWGEGAKRQHITNFLDVSWHLHDGTGAACSWRCSPLKRLVIVDSDQCMCASVSPHPHASNSALSIEYCVVAYEVGYVGV